jgi:hypothetical protein
MKKAIGPQVFVAEFGGSGMKGTRAAYTRTSASHLDVHEDWFRDAISDNPELVIAPCRQAGLVPTDETWTHWATEFPLDAGSVDVLLLASSGRVGIVETKLSYNPQVRREVVAQILDYALALQEADDLPPLPERDPVKEPRGAVPEEADVRERIGRGEFLLVVAGDEIDPRALRLGEAVLAGHLTSEWDLAMVDLNVYEGEPSATPRYLLIPELRGVMSHETRQVVRVVTEGDRTRVKVERINAAPATAARTSRDWDEQSFFDELKLNVDADTVTAIHDGYVALRMRGYTIKWGHGNKQGFVYAADPARSWKDVLYFDTWGRLWLDPRALPEPAAEEVRAALGRLGFGMDGKKYIAVRVADTRSQLTKVLDAIDEVRRSS